MMQDDFIAKVAPGARAAMARTGVPASVTIAQAILESNWGRSESAIVANNLFGVKADASWHGPTVSIPTREFLNKVWVTVPALWRKYDSIAAAIDDHDVFLKANKRYAELFPFTTTLAFAKGLQKNGYATDPGYADKLQGIIASRKLEQYDA